MRQREKKVPPTKGGVKLTPMKFKRLGQKKRQGRKSKRRSSYQVSRKEAGET